MSDVVESPPTDRPERVAARRPRTRVSGPAPSALAIPGLGWGVVLAGFVGYALLATAFGSVDGAAGDVRTEWNPFDWDLGPFGETIASLAGGDAAGVALRTVSYALGVVAVCALVGLPVAYYVARRAGRSRFVLLGLLVLPLLVGATVRTVALAGVFGADGVADRIAAAFGADPGNWLSGRTVTIVIGLCSTALPLFVVIATVAIARIDQRLLDVARDLGAAGFGFVFGVVAPLARRGVTAAFVAVGVVVVGDFWTARMLSHADAETTSSNDLLAGRVEELVAASPGADARSGTALAVVLLVVIAPAVVLRLRVARWNAGGLA